VRRVFAWSAVLAAVVLVASPAWAAWVWRNGKWIYIEDRAMVAAPAAGEAGETPNAVEPTPAPPEPPVREPLKPTPAPPEEAAPVVHPEAPPPGMPPAATADLPPAGADEGEPIFQEGRAAAEAGRASSAAGTFAKLIKQYPTSAYRPEAMWLRAEALFAAKDYDEAYHQYEQLMDEYAGSPHYGAALKREMEIADLYLGPVRQRVLGLPLLSGEDEAIAILRRVYEHQPLGDLADDVILRIADYYWSKRRWEEAEQYYDKYCREYPNIDPAKCRHAELQRAKCAIERCRGVRYDTSSLNLAYDRLSQYEKKYPEEAQAEGVPALKQQVGGKLAESLYRVAEYYARAGQPEAAAYYAGEIQAKYPDTPWSAKARKFAAKAPAKAQE